MRGNRDARFVIDALWVRNDVNVKLLGTSDLGGLLNLMAVAWMDARCSIPSGDHHLAALSEMGEGDWLGSKLRRHLHLFFRPLEDGRLQCIILEGDRAKEEDIKDKRRRAGRASASARLMKAMAALTPLATPADSGDQLPPLPNRADWMKAGDVTDQQLRDIYAAARGRCHYCGDEVKDPLYHPRRFRGFDHVVPMCQGGRHTAGNIVVSCRPCNCAKGGSERRNAKKVRERNTRATHDERVCLPPSTTRSTLAQQVCIMCCTGVDVEAGRWAGYVYNVLPETQLEQVAWTPAASDPAAFPPAPGKLYCSGNDACRSTAVTCDPQAQPEPRPTPRCAPRREVASPPPTPPLERGSSFDSSFKEESEERSSISGGGSGEGPKPPKGATVQLDLFGTPPDKARPKRPRGARVTQAVQEAACRVVDAYQLSVGPSHRRTPQADRNVAWWIVDGHSEEDLTRSAKNYAAFCDRAERDPDFRKSAVNFFGRKDPVSRSFLKETQDGTLPAPQQRYVERLEARFDAAFERVTAATL